MLLLKFWQEHIYSVVIDTVEVVSVTGWGADSSCLFAAAMIAVAFSLARACQVALALTAHNRFFPRCLPFRDDLHWLPPIQCICQAIQFYIIALSSQNTKLMSIASCPMMSGGLATTTVLSPLWITKNVWLKIKFYGVLDRSTLTHFIWTHIFHFFA